MTTPDRAGAPEELGMIELFGERASALTRTIHLALTELNIHFVWITRASHSDDTSSRHAYASTPLLVHRPDGLYTRSEDVVSLSGAFAIRRYIDELLAPLAIRSGKGLKFLTPPLGVSSGTVEPCSVIARAKLDALVAKFSHTIIPTLDSTYMKPASLLAKQGQHPESINTSLAEGLARIHSLLEIVQPQAATQWILPGTTNQLTWADLFLYPILADLRASPAAHFVSGDSPNFTWLAAWLQRMDQRESVQLAKNA